MKPKIQNTIMIIFMGVLLYGAMLIVSFHVGKAMDDNIKLDTISAVGVGIKNAINDPFGFTPLSATSLPFIGISTFAMLIVTSLYT